MLLDIGKLSHGGGAAGGSRSAAADHPTVGSKSPAGGTIKAPIVVLGATGAVGRGAVRAAIEVGRPVIAVGRNLQQLVQLRLEHRGADASVLATTIAADPDGARLAEMLRRDGRPLAGVVDAMSGDEGRGRLIDHPSDVLRRTLDDDLLPHLAAARHLIPLLAEARRVGSYVFIGGPGTETPWSNYGFRSVAAAGLRMLACVLHDEARLLDVRVQMLSIGAPVRGETPCAHHCPEWPSGLAIGRRALQLIDRDRPGESASPVVRFARLAVHNERDVESATAETTTRRPSVPDVRSFLKPLSSIDRNEVDADDTP
jgi:NAD(P)-dependent dehydrogenase (short-subunit alcohol dehydrogenase family)